MKTFMKMHVTFAFAMLVFTCISWGTCADRFKKEGHHIMKRLAQAGNIYEGHDVAHVFVAGQGHYHGISRRDVGSLWHAHHSNRTRDFRLHLSTGSSVTLSLTQVPAHSESISVYVRTTNGRRSKRKYGISNCYANGRMQDSSGSGLAAISYCNGVFGFANSIQYDYFFHPVGIDTSVPGTEDDTHAIHVIWRRSVPNSQNALGVNFNEHDGYEEESGQNETLVSQRGNEQITPAFTSIVVEMALFIDTQYWKELSRLYPGREDDYLLVQQAGVQALYGNSQKIGFDVEIKLKYLEYWKTKPEGYNPARHDMYAALKAFCEYTNGIYFYDVHAFFTRTLNWSRNAIGIGFIGGACGPRRCITSAMLNMNSYKVYAHELGHNLGLLHPWSYNCTGFEPSQGFMDSRASIGLNFSPCMKHQLAGFLNSSRANCLFEETEPSLISADKLGQTRDVFPGQSHSPDELCELMAGSGYRYIPLAGDTRGDAVCQWWACLNDNKTSVEFGKLARFMHPPTGFPCGEEQFCFKVKCFEWDESKFGLNFQELRALKSPSHWGPWSSIEDYQCSRSCGTGVRLRRRRECLINGGLSLSPFCRGTSVQAELCNTHPCQSDNTTSTMMTSQASREARKEEVCSRFRENDVQLAKINANGFPSRTRRKKFEVEKSTTNIHSISCLLYCPGTPRGKKEEEEEFHAIMPDGCPCSDTQRSRDELVHLNISLHCVRGFCTEFSDPGNETHLH